MSDLLNLTTRDRKYTVVQKSDGRLQALRYGEPWRELTGDNLVLALAQEVDQLRTKLAAAKAALHNLVWKDPDDGCYYGRYTEETDLTSDVRSVLEDDNG